MCARRYLTPRCRCPIRRSSTTKHVWSCRLSACLRVAAGLDENKLPFSLCTHASHTVLLFSLCSRDRDEVRHRVVPASASTAMLCSMSVLHWHACLLAVQNTAGAGLAIDVLGLNNITFVSLLITNVTVNHNIGSGISATVSVLSAGPSASDVVTNITADISGLFAFGNAGPALFLQSIAESIRISGEAAFPAVTGWNSVVTVRVHGEAVVQVVCFGNVDAEAVSNVNVEQATTGISAATPAVTGAGQPSPFLSTGVDTGCSCRAIVAFLAPHCLEKRTS